MASFPDLRPDPRSANAESKAVRTFRTPVLLAVSAALCLTAFLAVSELATLRGAKAPDTSAYLAKELGPPLDHSNLVRGPALIRPALGGRLEIRDGGLRVRSGRESLALRFGAKTKWRLHAKGAVRSTTFGREAITFGDNSVEQSLLVEQAQGTKTWTWDLHTKLGPRLLPDGSVRFGGQGCRVTQSCLPRPASIRPSTQPRAARPTSA